METEVIRIDRCENCGEKIEYIVRSSNVNSSIKDEGIMLLVKSKSTDPQRFDCCEECGLYTLHTTVGWKGL